MNKSYIIKQLYQISKLFKIDTSLLFYLKTLYNKPSTLMIHPNYECNFNCSYCYLEKKKGECLSFNKLIELIKQAKRLGVYSVDILGGEPLMYKDLERLIYFIMKNKMLVNIFTNAALINIPFLQRLKGYQKKIMFVIKLDSEKCYKKQNKPTITFKELRLKIRLTKKFGFRVITFIVITSKNYSHVNPILNFCNKEKIFPIFERFGPVNNQKINSNLMLNSKMWYYVLKKVKAFWENKGVKDFIDFYGKLNGGICSCLSNNIAVMQDGTVKPCPEAHEDLTYGNINKKTLKKIWHDSLKLRKEFMNIPRSCKNCINSQSCRGGCKIYTYQIQGNLKEKDPLCENNIPTTFPHCAFSIVRFYKLV